MMSEYTGHSEKYGSVWMCPNGHLHANFKDEDAFGCNACVELQQQRERANILRFALDRIWTSSMTAELAQQIAGTALAEWKLKGADVG